MKKTLLLLFTCVVITQALYSRVKLSSQYEVQDNNPTIIPFKVIADRSNMYDSTTYKMKIPHAGRYYVESHVHLKHGNGTTVKILLEDNGNEQIVKSCVIDKKEKCKFAEKTTFKAGVQVYIKVYPKDNTTTILQDDTYMFLAKRS